MDRALLLDERDNVAAVLAKIESGVEVPVQMGSSMQIVCSVTAKDPVPFGHKLATADLRKGDAIVRYGHPIGYAMVDIRRGSHVHIHNMRSYLSPADNGADEGKAPKVRSPEWIRTTVTRIFVKSGLPAHVADAITDVVVEAHLRGVETHGLRRVRPYIARIQSGGVDGSAEPILDGAGAFLRIDGRNGVGHYIGSVSANAVSEAASKYGISIAVVRKSNHFGFAGYYATRIAANNQIGIVVSNGQVCVGPPGARKPLFSNNPLAIAAPTARAERFMELDLATSVTSRANVVEAVRKRSRLPEGWAQDDSGHPTRDPREALQGSLLPFGGEKGFGLLVALEALTGVLSGGAYADLVASKEASPAAPEGTCYTLIAIDLAYSMQVSDFTRRLNDLFERIASLPMGLDSNPPRYPGERRWKLRKERLANGIPLSPSDVEDISSLANELGIETP